MEGQTNPYLAVNEIFNVGAPILTILSRHLRFFRMQNFGFCLEKDKETITI